jgi:2-oxoglutarate dehydrogenase E2 component (dihydrolipoamide succinyltransferase)
LKIKFSFPTPISKFSNYQILKFSTMLEVKIPPVGESISEVTIANWLVKNGDYVKQDQVLCEMESDKATFELNAEQAGTITIVIEAGTDAAIGDVVCKIDTSAAAPADAPKAEAPKAEVKKEEPKQEAPKAEAPVAVAADGYAKGHAGPAAAKLASENGVNLSKVSGTAKGGRITKADVLAALESGAAQVGDLSLTGTGGSREQEKKKMSNLRKTIAKRLLAAKNETAMLTTFNEVDMGPIMDLRTQYKDKFKETHGVGLGFMSFFTKACAIALLEFPAVNGIIEDDSIVFHNYVDMGVAVSTPKGLVVPVIRNAESLTMAGIEKAVVDVAIKARDGKLTLEEMTGGTFTITNGGVFGSLMSTPILNSPQSAILGMHKIQDRPMAINGKVEIRPMMYLALSYDHRVIDGKESVSFLVRVKHLLENPNQLLFGEDPTKLLLGLK